MLGVVFLIIVLAAFGLVCWDQFNRRRRGGWSPWMAAGCGVASVSAGVAVGLDAPVAVVAAAWAATCALAWLATRSGRSQQIR